MTRVSMGVEDKQLKCVLSIQYLMNFKKNHTEVQALIDSGSKFNAMALVYTAILGLHVYSIDVKAPKIDGSIYLTHGMVLANF